MLIPVILSGGAGTRLWPVSREAHPKPFLENPGVIDLVMIEVQVGEYLGEDDIVRFQDNYGRT